MKIKVTLEATQFNTAEDTFMGQPVLKFKKDYKVGIDEIPYSILSINGEAIKIEEGQWFVEYPDGTKEVWSDEKVKTDTADITEEEKPIKAQSKK